MNRRFVSAVVLAALMALALSFRLPDLGNRPMHGDEAVHAFKFKELWERGVYRYDPNEFHGPTLYYAALPTVWLSGHHRFPETREADYRLAIAILGAAIIPLLWLLRDGLGRGAILWAGLLTAISPALVFYSRYYIQETLLALFTLALIGCLWRYTRSRNVRWVVGMGISAGLMIATKETAVLAFIALGIAWLSARMPFALLEPGSAGSSADPQSPESGRRLERALSVSGSVKGTGFEMESAGPVPGIGAQPTSWDGSAPAWRAPVLATLIAAAVAYLFLSGFFSDPAGPLGYFRAYAPWLRRAGATSLHNHPWTYYLRMLLWTHSGRGPVWSEGLIVGLAIVGGVMAFRSNRGEAAFARYITVFTLALTILYSAIPYKTPWCALSFLVGMIVLAGYGASGLMELAKRVPVRVAVALALLVGCAQLGQQAYRASFVYATDSGNPYVYAQPLPDVIAIGKRVEDLAKVSPLGSKMTIKVFSSDEYYWPLPWYLRQFENVGYWTSLPADVDAPVVIASPSFDEELTRRLDPTHIMTGIFGLRPRVFLEVWVRMDLWKPYVETLNRTRKTPAPTD